MKAFEARRSYCGQHSCGSVEDMGGPHAQQRAGDIIISSVTSWRAGRQQTAGSTACSDANSNDNMREKQSEKEWKTVYENGGGPTQELK